MNSKCFYAKDENEISFFTCSYFQKVKHCVQTQNICAIYGDSAIAGSIIYKRFANFRKGNFNLED